MSRFSLAALLLLTACEEFGANVPDDRVFDIDRFEENLWDTFVDQTVGFAFVINEGGRLARDGAWGDSNRGLDGDSQRDMSIETVMPIASCSKPLTAMAAVPLLEQNGLELDDPMSMGLSPEFESIVRDDYADVTFRDLLTHDTFIPFDNGPDTLELYGALRDEPLGQHPGYQNGNFGLFRVILGWLYEGVNSSIPLSAENYVDAMVRVYNDRVMWPAEITGALYEPNEAVRTFQWPSTRELDAGVPSLNQRNRAGDTGLQMGARHLAQILAYYRYTDLIVDVDQRVRIEGNELGFDASRNGLVGRYLAKAGGHTHQALGGRGFRCMIMMFPNEVEAVVLTNTNFPSLGQSVAAAYDGAWVQPEGDWR